MFAARPGPPYALSLLLANPVAAIRIPAALVAQLVEHLICNQGVAGSNPAGGTILSMA